MNKTPSNGKFDGLMQNRTMNIVLLIVLGLFIVVGIFALINQKGTNPPQAASSLSQALTMVAAASQTVQLTAGPGSPLSSSVDATPTIPALSSQAALLATANSAAASTANSGDSGQNNYQPATSTVPVSDATSRPTDSSQAATSTFPLSNVTVRPTYTRPRSAWLDNEFCGRPVEG